MIDGSSRIFPSVPFDLPKSLYLSAWHASMLTYIRPSLPTSQIAFAASPQPGARPPDTAQLGMPKKRVWVSSYLIVSYLPLAFGPYQTLPSHSIPTLGIVSTEASKARKRRVEVDDHRGGFVSPSSYPGWYGCWLYEYCSQVTDTSMLFFVTGCSAASARSPWTLAGVPLIYLAGPAWGARQRHWPHCVAHHEAQSQSSVVTPTVTHSSIIFHWRDWPSHSRQIPVCLHFCPPGPFVRPLYVPVLYLRKVVLQGAYSPHFRPSSSLLLPLSIHPDTLLLFNLSFFPLYTIFPSSTSLVAVWHFNFISYP